MRNAFLAVVGLCVLGPAERVWADQNPATDNVPQLFSYGGVLEKDGAAVSGELTMTFVLYDGSNTTPVWRETQSVNVYRGRFAVLLGECEGQTSNARCPDGDANTSVHIMSIVQNADDLTLAVELDSGNGVVVLQQRKRFVPVPYARLSVAAPDLEVANNADVGNNLHVQNQAQVSGNADVQGTLKAGPYLPRSRAWDGNVTGDNQAAVYNDITSYKKLMVVGNNAAGGQREVGVWDNLTVAGRTSTNTLRASSTDLECVWSACYDTPVSNGAICANLVPGYPILGGIDVAVDDAQKPVRCTGTNHEDEIALYCCRISRP